MFEMEVRQQPITVSSSSKPIGFVACKPSTARIVPFYFYLPFTGRRLCQAPRWFLPPKVGAFESMLLDDQSLTLFRLWLPVKPTESSTAALKVWYCLCGEFLVSFMDSLCRHILTLLPWKLVIDKDLNKLPRRKTDGAIMMRCRDSSAGKAAVFKLNSNESGPLLMKRLVYPSSSEEPSLHLLC